MLPLALWVVAATRLTHSSAQRPAPSRPHVPLLRSRTYNVFTLEAPYSTAQPAGTAPTFGQSSLPKKAVLPELEEALLSESPPKPALIIEDLRAHPGEGEEATTVEDQSIDEVSALDDVEKKLRKARKENEDVFNSVEQDKVEDKAVVNQSLAKVEESTEDEVKRLSGVEKTLRQARDALTAALDESEQAKKQAVVVAQEVIETERRIKQQKVRNSQQYDLFRTLVSFALGSMVGKYLPKYLKELVSMRSGAACGLPKSGKCLFGRFCLQP